MRNYTNILNRVPLFEGIDAHEIPSLLQCLGAQTRSFARDEFIYTAGDEAVNVGVILSGRVQISRHDINGNRSILAEAATTDLFAESFACAQTAHIPVDVYAVEAAEILFVNCRRIITLCPNSCRFHARLVENLLKIVASKNIMLNQKLEIVSKRTMREKLLAYLNAEAQKQRCRTVTIPFDRQELADFLGVDRSALSRELGVMRQEGVLKVRNRDFELPE